MDPARKVVESVLALHPEVEAEVKILENPIKTCALKCAAQAQTARNLTTDFEFLAFLDGDVIPFPSWLRTLLEPMKNLEYDFCTGYRWFIPVGGGVGTLVRYVWNAASCVHVFLNGVIWGGSNAIRSSAFEKYEIASHWEKTMTDDVVTAQIAFENHRKVAFVPQILMANREECSLKFAYRWCSRQTFFVRMYFLTMWRRMIAISLFLTFVHLASFGLLVCALSTGDVPLLCVTLGGLIFFWISSCIFAPILEWSARRCIAENQEPVKWNFSFPILKIVVSLPFTLVVFTLGLIRAGFIKDVVWRGIHYRIYSRKTIERMNYEPFIPMKPAENSTSQNVSIE